jgi:hypothetical protein
LWHETHAEEDDKFEFLAVVTYLAVVWERRGGNQIRPGRDVFEIFPCSQRTSLRRI